MDENQLGRPEDVGTAVVLLYVSLGIGGLGSILEATVNAQMASPAPVMFTTLVTLGVIWLLTYKTGKGRNWARITLLVLLVFGIPFFVQSLLQNLAANPFSGLLGIGQTVLQIISLVLLFQRQSTDWFKHMKTQKKLA